MFCQVSTVLILFTMFKTKYLNIAFSVGNSQKVYLI